MKYGFFLLLFVAGFFCSKAQQTAWVSDPDRQFKQAKEYFQKAAYSLAYPLFRELKKDAGNSPRSEYPVTLQEIEFFDIACGLQQNEEVAVDRALDFIRLAKNTARVQGMHYHLGEYFFRHNDPGAALQQYEEVDESNIDPEQLSAFRFHKGYAYFSLNDYVRAKSLLAIVKNDAQAPDYFAANYYYGMIAFREGNYTEALNSFSLVETHKEFSHAAPYYIAQVYYLQGDKTKSLNYAVEKLRTGSGGIYELQLKKMIGHTYFELREFGKSLPYLQEYVAKSSPVSNEDVYELSYAYYQSGNLQKAIEGFKQLSGGQDAISQHAMYLLGDAYLKIGQKASARSAFLFCASNSSNPDQKEISKFNYAKLSYELGYQNEALTGLRTFVREYPRSAYNTEARELLVAALANTNNYKDALSTLETLKNTGTQTSELYARVYFGRATELINDDLLLQADALLDKVLSPNTSNRLNALTNFWKGEIAYRQNKLEDAVRYFNNYLQSGAPENGEATPTTAKYNLGYTYLKKESFNMALQELEAITRSGLNTNLEKDAFLRSGDAYFMLKNYSKAKEIYKTVIEAHWPTADYATYQSAMIDGIKNPKDKVTLMAEVIKKYPQSTLQDDANMEIALTYMSGERFQEAIPYLQKVIEGSQTESYKPKAYYTLGTAYYNLNKNNEALMKFKELVSKYPNSEEAEDALSDIKRIYTEENKPNDYIGYMRDIGKNISTTTADSLSYSIAYNKYEDGDLSGALESFENYLKQYPAGTNQVAAQYHISDIYNGRKEWDRALAGYETVASKAPNSFAERAMLMAGDIFYFEKKDYSNAEKYYQQLVNSTTNAESRTKATRGLLRSRYELKKWNEALELAQEAQKTDALSTDDKALATMIIAKSGLFNKNYAEALSSLNTVISLSTGALAAEARYEIANIYWIQNNLKEAEKAAFETIKKSGSYGYWVTKSYLLLGDIYLRQKDYFNAKATFQSVAENGTDEALRAEAKRKVKEITDMEKKK